MDNMQWFLNCSNDFNKSVLAHVEQFYRYSKMSVVENQYKKQSVRSFKGTVRLMLLWLSINLAGQSLSVEEDSHQKRKKISRSRRTLPALKLPFFYGTQAKSGRGSGNSIVSLGTGSAGTRVLRTRSLRRGIICILITIRQRSEKLAADSPPFSAAASMCSRWVSSSLLCLILSSLWW